MRVTPLKCPRKPTNQWRCALASEPRKMVPACSVARASRSLVMKILAPEVHFVAWKSLPKKLWNFFTEMVFMANSSMQNSLASSTLVRSMAMVSLMGSKNTPIQVMMVVGP